VSLPSGIVSSLNDFTISVWVKLDTRSTWTRIFDLGTGTNANMFLTPQSSSNGMRFAITTGGYGKEQQINSTTALPTGVWKHVAVTKSGNVANLYVDGVVVGSNSNMTLSPSNLGNTTVNYIGRSQYNDPYLDGQVDSFKVYNRALSAAEVASEFSGSTSTPSPTATATSTATAIPTPTPTSGTGSYVWNYGNVPGATIEAWNDNPTLTAININPYGKPALTIPYGYILLNEGPNGTSQVARETQLAILKRINEDLKWESETLGIHLPPWATGKTGTKYIDYFFTNTGLPNDPGASGYQGWEGSYPCVVTDSNGMSSQNRYNLTHEFNHVLLNSYGTIPGNSVSWIHESMNDYMILRLAEWRSGATPGQSQQFAFPSGIGYLDAEVYKQPYVPIESCGINSAGEATSPADYMNDSTGFRYNDLFPLFVSQRVGMTFYAKVIEAAKTTEQNLQTMTRLLDKQRVQSMVTEYAARLALGDFMEFSNSIQGLASTSMYAATINQSGWLVPSDKNKLPRYTGRNNIPITVSQGATEVTVDFAPDAQGSNGTAADMRAQIVYRATDGTTVFSTPVASGKTTIKLTKAPKYGVVIVVISNVTMSGYKKVTSYGWDPTEKFGYKIQVTGGAAAPTSRLYF
ncbi:MAG TPA: LamG-like jellyroll fold domain-containing protein, partial [Bacillota bacterium]|nr:LamG-like jellyroll fold domain-containing protein [Bacillota bacterium]